MNKIINPDAAVLWQTDGQWQKIATFIIAKLVPRGQSVTITAEDMKRLERDYAPGIPVLATIGHYDSFEFKIVTEEEAKRLAEHDRTMRGAA